MKNVPSESPDHESSLKLVAEATGDTVRQIREDGVKKSLGKLSERILGSLTQKERSLVDAFRTSLEASEAYLTNPQCDAFRHIYFSALFQRILGSNATLILGEFNELGGATRTWLKGNGFDSGWLMDRYNNMIGIELAENNPSLSNEALANKVQEIVNNGEFYLEDGITLYKDSEQEASPV